jgi:small subunit ribosomal protein S8
MLFDVIADMFVRIKNGYMAGKKTVRVPHSKFKHEVAKVLLKEGFIKGIKEEKKDNNKKDLVFSLKYEKGKPVITKIQRISKVSRRVYTQAKNLPMVLSGFGIAIVSTPKGVLTAKQARKKGVGGEIICKIW